MAVLISYYLHVPFSWSVTTNTCSPSLPQILYSLQGLSHHSLVYATDNFETYFVRSILLAPGVTMVLKTDLSPALGGFLQPAVPPPLTSLSAPSLRTLSHLTFSDDLPSLCRILPTRTRAPERLSRCLPLHYPGWHQPHRNPSPRTNFLADEANNLTSASSLV